MILLFKVDVILELPFGQTFGTKRVNQHADGSILVTPNIACDVPVLGWNESVMDFVSSFERSIGTCDVV